MHKAELRVSTRGKGLYDITAEVSRAVRGSGIDDGLVLVFVPHTSASLVIQENADPRVQRDLADFLERLVPEGDPHYTHTSEGPDDMPAHIRTALTHTAEVLPLESGRLALGTWQALYLFEHRSWGHERRVLVRVLD